MLQTSFLLVNKIENPNRSNQPTDNIWFEHDGTPLYFACNVSDYLNNTFIAPSIGHRGTID